MRVPINANWVVILQLLQDWIKGKDDTETPTIEEGLIVVGDQTLPEDETSPPAKIIENYEFIPIVTDVIDPEETILASSPLDIVKPTITTPDTTVSTSTRPIGSPFVRI